MPMTVHVSVLLPGGICRIRRHDHVRDGGVRLRRTGLAEVDSQRRPVVGARPVHAIVLLHLQ